MLIEPKQIPRVLRPTGRRKGVQHSLRVNGTARALPSPRPTTSRSAVPSSAGGGLGWGQAQGNDATLQTRHPSTGFGVRPSAELGRSPQPNGSE